MPLPDLPNLLSPNILSNAPIGVYLSTPKGRFLYANFALAHILGYASEQELVDTVQDIATQIYAVPEDRTLLQQMLEEKGQATLQEFCFLRKDGSKIWVSENACKVVDEQGNTLHYYGFCVDISARKKSEAKLQEQEETYRRLFETMNQGLLYQDATGKNILANPAAERILGMSQQEILGRGPSSLRWEIINELGESLQESDLPSMIALRTGKPVERFILGLRNTKKKEFAWLSVTSIPLFHKHSSTPFQVHTIFEDITAQRVAENRYRMLFQEMITGFALHEIICDSQGNPVNYRFLEVNPAFEKLTGLSRNKVIGRTVLEVLPQVEQIWIENYGKVALTGQTHTFEQYSIDLGKCFAVSAFCPSQGQFACIFLDITERKKMEITLAEEEQKYRFLADNIDDVIWVLDANFRFTYISPSVYKLHGLTLEESMHETVPETMTPESWQRVEQVLEQIFSEKINIKEDTIRLELEQYRKDGSTVWVEIIVRILLDEHDQIYGYLGVTRDISESKAMRQQLVETRNAAEAANKAKSEFLANMSHEIRTPLNGIMGMLQLLQMTTLDSEQSKYVDLSLISADRLTRLLSDILDLSRVEAGKMDLFATEFSLQELHDSVLQLFMIQAQKKSVVLQWHMDPSIPAIVIGDEARVRQILFNLVGNALKFTQVGHIDINFVPLRPTKQDDLRVLITVADTGSGISEEGLQRIFQPFSQVDNSYARTHQGAGLGLAIVHRLVELMQGHIQIESVLGQGTSIHIVLPFGLPDSIKPQQNSDSRSVPTTTRPLRILLAEDEPCNQEATTQLLKKLGHSVTLAENGMQVLELLRQHNFDCILMDIQMPIMDGVQTTKAIRSGEIEAKSKIPIIALTAYAMTDDRDEFLQAGMTDYLPKPVSNKELQRALSLI